MTSADRQVGRPAPEDEDRIYHTVKAIALALATSC